MKRNKMVATLAMTSLMISSASQAAFEPYEPGRGPYVEPLAASCNIGPFGQLGKAGPYNDLCDSMPDTEKCLALLKRHMDRDGVMKPVWDSDIDRTKYCLDTFEAALLGN